MRLSPDDPCVRGSGLLMVRPPALARLVEPMSCSGARPLLRLIGVAESQPLP